MAKPSSSSDNGDLPDIPETVAFTTATTSQTTNELPLTTSSTLAHFTYVLTIYRYVLLCLLFGSMSVVIGFTLLSISLILRAKTSSLHLIESVPLYMPGLIVSISNQKASHVISCFVAVYSLFVMASP